MIIFKCKMCGGAMEVNNESVATCEYCGTQQTLPKLDDERKANLYDRANHFRCNNEFDKAMGIYEQILNEDNTDAESYWSLVLCRYGIEYVEDPSSHKRIPTVNRAQFTSIFDDDNYKSALQYADSYQKSIYEEEAKAINEIQKGILAISQKEEPFDVFICYKETDNNGRRTPDSVLANDLYHQLIQEGFKVFFARITLEDKLGSAYEPYIFAALNSSKVMLVLGTKPEYFNAVWVKNEWSRYLSLIKNGAKKMLIPAYKDMDPYDLPEEFSHLQAQDMSRLGFMQDLIRGIKKIAQDDEPKATVVKETVVSTSNANTAPLLKRVFMFLEDSDWVSANEYCEKVLDIDPENAMAYVGKLMAELRVKKQDDLKDCAEPFNGNNNYQKVMRFGDDNLKSALIGYIQHIKERNENARLEAIYNSAKTIMFSAVTESNYKLAAQKFENIRSYKDTENLIAKCYEKAEEERKNSILDDASYKARSGKIEDIRSALNLFESISGWKYADERIEKCKKKIEELEAKAEEERKETERIKKLIKKIVIIAIPIICVIIALAILIPNVIIPSIKYNAAIKLMNQGYYYDAAYAFDALDGYKDSEKKIDECSAAMLDDIYNYAITLMDEGKYEEAIEHLEVIEDYRDVTQEISECKYCSAIALMDKDRYADAKEAFEALDGYKDSVNKINECNTIIFDSKYNNAVALMNEGNYADAIRIFGTITEYKDSDALMNSCYYTMAIDYLNNGNRNEALELLRTLALEAYKDSADIAAKIIFDGAWETEYGAKMTIDFTEKIVSEGTETMRFTVFCSKDVSGFIALEAGYYDEIIKFNGENCIIWEKRGYRRGIEYYKVS